MRYWSAVLAIFALILCAVPAASQHWGELEEQIAITATGATTIQTSEIISKPKDAKGLLVIMDVTGPGSGLLLDVNMSAYSPTLNTTTNHALNCPSPGGITGTSRTWCAYVPYNITSQTITDFLVHIPNQFKLYVDVGNATPATYTLYYQWLF